MDFEGIQEAVRRGGLEAAFPDRKPFVGDGRSGFYCLLPSNTPEIYAEPRLRRRIAELEETIHSEDVKAPSAVWHARNQLPMFRSWLRQVRGGRIPSGAGEAYRAYVKAVINHNQRTQATEDLEQRQE